MPAPDPLTSLRAALAKHSADDTRFPEHIEAAIVSAVKACLPGRQQKKNVAEYVKLGRAAFVRTLRRRAWK